MQLKTNLNRWVLRFRGTTHSPSQLNHVRREAMPSWNALARLLHHDVRVLDYVRQVQASFGHQHHIVAGNQSGRSGGWSAAKQHRQSGEQPPAHDDGARRRSHPIARFAHAACVLL